MKLALTIVSIVMLFLTSTGCKGDTSKEQSKKIVKPIQSNQSSSNNIHTTLQMEQLHGHVKTMKKSTYLAKRVNGQVQKVSLGTIYIYSFNSKGSIQEKKYYNSTGGLQNKTIYVNDKYGLSEKATVYDNSGKIIKSIAFVNNTVHDRIEEHTTNPAGKQLSKVTYQYNDNGLVKQEKKYARTAIPEMITTYYYNQVGENDQTEIRLYNSTLPIITNLIYTRKDTLGNWLQCTQHTSNGSWFIIEREIQYYKKTEY